MLDCIACQYEPSRETIGVISMLLNATTPFFLDDDPPDIEPPPDPPTKKPPIRGYNRFHSLLNISDNQLI